MKTLFLQNEIIYTGLELNSVWIQEHAAVAGDCLLSFIGPADVPITNMVDLEDVKNNAPIYSPKMLHFLAYHPEIHLELAVSRQQIFVLLVIEWLQQQIKSARIRRRGNDIYLDERKLSVSIAAPAPQGCCLHFEMNIETAGTPVPTFGLTELGIAPQSAAQILMERYNAELVHISRAQTKVKDIL